MAGDDGSSHSSNDDDSSLAHEDRRKRKKHRKSSSKQEKKTKKKLKKKRKKSHEKHHKKSLKRNRIDDYTSEDPFESSSYRLADALCTLLNHHPAMAEDLPAILVQLANGTTLNLSTSPVRTYLSAIFAELTPYGVEIVSSDIYSFQSLGGRTRDELVLVRVVRSMLDRIGVTMEAIASDPDDTASAVREAKPQELSTQRFKEKQQVEENKIVETKTIQLIRDFGTSDLAKELVSLCQTILDGEVIALDGIPDERLKHSLQSLFHDTCGMIPSEIDDEDGDDGEAATTGLGLPDDQVLATIVGDRIQKVRQTCSQQADRVMKGPLPRPIDDSEDDEDDGPLLPGQTRRTFGTASAPAVPIVGSEGGREEWMLVPGKFDLLTGLKSGQPIRNRQFSGKRKDDGAAEPKVDPRIEEEIRHLREVHEASRGPSLMEEHRMRKQEEAARKKGKKSDWKWDRSSDLDAGRRVDKDALKAMLGGANTNLNGKFHSSL